MHTGSLSNLMTAILQITANFKIRKIILQFIILLTFWSDFWNTTCDGLKFHNVFFAILQKIEINKNNRNKFWCWKN